MASDGSGSFFHIKPKILVLMVIYMSLMYACNYAFVSGANYENTQFGYMSSTSKLVNVETENKTQQERTTDGAIEGGIVGFLFGCVAVAIGVLLTPVTGGISLAVALAVVGGFTGVGATAGAIQGYTNVTVEIWIISDVIEFFKNISENIVNFIKMLLDFLSFGVINSANTPNIPYPFNLIPFLFTLPIIAILGIWITGLAIESLKASDTLTPLT
jgi:hypothetical protein